MDSLLPPDDDLHMGVSAIAYRSSWRLFSRLYYDQELSAVELNSWTIKKELARDGVRLASKLCGSTV